MKYLSYASLILFLLIISSCKQNTKTADLIVVPLRWCVIEGSSEASGASPGSLVPTPRTARDRILDASEIWAPANILFLSLVITDENGQKGLPVIRDPFVGEGENTGDIDARPGSGQPAQAVAACDSQWKKLDPGAEGPVVVTARRFIGIALAVSSSPRKSLWVKQASPLTGKRGDDMCGEPRQLTPNDVFNLSPSNGNGQGWVVLQEPEQYSNADHLTKSLAHELGHMLFLGHGNGLDDNADGNLTGLGPRRFDHYCDPLGVTSSGKPSEDISGCSLMGQSASCTTITPLQVEMARAVARLMPGCSGTPCAVP